MSKSAAKVLHFEQRGAIGHVRLARPAKRNALSDELVLSLQTRFAQMPDSVKAIVLDGEGEHFSAGLDLSELQERGTAETLHHSMMWHSAFQAIQFGRVPVVVVMHGAVVGGGLELACAAHIRVAERSTFYALPEGSRGLFVGGGGSVRLPRIIGFSRMVDMMLTGRVYNSEEGHDIGISHYLTDEGAGLAKATELAERIAANSPMTNFAVMHALPRIADQSMSEGFLTEALMATIAAGTEETKERVRAFLEKRAGKVK